MREKSVFEKRLFSPEFSPVQDGHGVTGTVSRLAATGTPRTRSSVFHK